MPDIADVLGKKTDSKPKNKKKAKAKTSKKNKNKRDEELLEEEEALSNEQESEEIPEDEQPAEETDELGELEELGELDEDESLDEEPPTEMPEEAEDPMAAMLNGQSQEPEAPPEPKERDRSLDPDILKELMMTGENTNGMFEPNPEEVIDDNDVIHEEVDDKAKVKTSGKVTARGDKYIKLFTDELKDNPGDFMVNTPKGRMSIAKAMQLGYNPVTKKFDKPKLSDELNGMLDGLNDGDKQGIANLLSPQNANIAPADASRFGLDASNPLVQQGAAPGMPQAVPPMPQGGGMMPQGAQMGAAPQQGMPQGGGADIMSLLGGGK